MKYEAGFIGAGNMGGALAAAVYKSVKSLAVFDRNEEKTAALKKTFKRVVITDPADLAANARFVFLAVKPNVILKVAAELKNLISEDTVVVTMAAGVALQEICEAVGTNRCIRIMPNTPAAVGQGMILYCCADGVSEQEEADFISVMKSAGVIDKLDEKLFDAAAALSGCGPAYVYMFAEALADGAVACGVPREKAALYAAQTILGSAAMLKESGKHPEKLKDEVCSPGGTTIEGVLALEQSGFRYAAASAVKAAYEKTAKLKK